MPPFSPEPWMSSPTPQFHTDDDEMDTADVCNSQCQQQNQPAPRSTQRRKGVRFTEYSKLKYIPSRNQYSVEELRSMYITDEDEHRIRCDICNILRKIEDGELPDSESEYFRGLEWRGISFLHHQRKASKEMALYTLLNQQLEADELSDDWIQNVYRRMTEEAAHRAVQVAKWDEHCA
mmetsp:Transcript_1/g.1  ORF Transcript_1/g.1 Transcript_1/m.1 type:complete len:178 (-) Transcript_1:234-767(-)|eukprot:CAMPEP_0172366654 /NCGR_PEP_ID=MMETSP1060-20121228/16284_1 /TAXON_ID=37318 /ORGANISM="Pseudo-nitzschia pungens, Strain cf. cingulata" /LENGTH=177 /DNA_ID=CAMNT_0013090589 /DNA_START=84 /DNA_END=617 /DNA_ORIENTATION=+